MMTQRAATPETHEACTLNQSIDPERAGGLRRPDAGQGGISTPPVAARESLWLHQSRTGHTLAEIGQREGLSRRRISLGLSRPATVNRNPVNGNCENRISTGRKGMHLPQLRETSSGTIPGDNPGWCRCSRSARLLLRQRVPTTDRSGRALCSVAWSVLDRAWTIIPHSSEIRSGTSSRTRQAEVQCHGRFRETRRERRRRLHAIQ